MKILWLYRHIPEYNFDHHLHMSFARFMINCPNITLKAYGPKIYEYHKDIGLALFDPKYSIHDLHNMFDFDVILVCTKSRCFFNYNPHENIAEGCWLPKGFNTCLYPKIVLEEDYHYEKNDDWYDSVGINLILQRHYSQSLRQNKVKMKFFPFSVDVSFFNHEVLSSSFQGSTCSLPLNSSRQRKLGFIGNYLDRAYIYRKTVRDTLVSLGLASAYNDPSGNVVKDTEYVRALRSFVAYISCGSIFEICAAKNLEIMACGGVLFTNKFKGIELLFPEDSYCSYKTDFSDVVANAKRLVSDNAYTEELKKNALKCVYSKHTHTIRVGQLLKIMKEIQ